MSPFNNLSLLLAVNFGTFRPYIVRNKKAILSQGELHDAASNFTMALCGFPAIAQLSCWGLSEDCSELSVEKRHPS